MAKGEIGPIGGADISKKSRTKIGKREIGPTRIASKPKKSRTVVSQMNNGSDQSLKRSIRCQENNKNSENRSRHKSSWIFGVVCLGARKPYFSARWQATLWPGRISFNSGATSRHLSHACGQRVWNTQPLNSSV